MCYCLPLLHWWSCLVLLLCLEHPQSTRSKNPSPLFSEKRSETALRTQGKKCSTVRVAFFLFRALGGIAPSVVVCMCLLSEFASTNLLFLISRVVTFGKVDILRIDYTYNFPRTKK